MWRDTKMFPGVLYWRYVEIDGILNDMLWNQSAWKSKCLKTSQGLTALTAQLTWWLVPRGLSSISSQASYFKRIQSIDQSFSMFPFQGSVAATSQRIIRWTELTFLSNPKSWESFSQIFIPHMLHFPNQGEYVTETPLGPGGEASYSTVSILPTSLPVSKRITHLEFLENKSMWNFHIGPYT